MMIVVTPYLKRQASTREENFPAHRRVYEEKFAAPRNFNGYTILLNETLTFLIELMHLMGLFALIKGL